MSLPQTMLKQRIHDVLVTLLHAYIKCLVELNKPRPSVSVRLTQLSVHIRIQRAIHTRAGSSMIANRCWMRCRDLMLFCLKRFDFMM